MLFVFMFIDATCYYHPFRSFYAKIGLKETYDVGHYTNK
jgi:hypothetical protein